MATRDPLALSDEDRLPWLEPIDDPDAPPPRRGWLGWAAAALLLLALIAGALRWWQTRTVEAEGTGELIAAPEGPYRVRPAQEGGMTIEGQGEMAFATSEGAQVRGNLDLSAVPEAPVERAPAAEATPAPKAGASASISDGGRIVAKTPPAAPALEALPGAVVQLGAFPSQEVARKSWDALQRFPYLAERGETIVRADVNGRTFYRLRVATGSAAEARDVCARLRVAGESCLVVN